MGNTKKVGKAGRFKARYGVGIRKKLAKVESKQKSKYPCPRCEFTSVKREKKGVFHCSKALSPEGIIILETETPINKRDLVRLEDAYGRKEKGYEGIESRIFLGDGLGFHLPNFCGDQLVYNVSKKLGDFNLRLATYKTAKELKETLESLDTESLVGILEGAIVDTANTYRLEPGDLTTIEELKKTQDFVTIGEGELLFITKNK